MIGYTFSQLAVVTRFEHVALCIGGDDIHIIRSLGGVIGFIATVITTTASGVRGGTDL